MFILLLIGGLKTSYLYGQFTEPLMPKQSFTVKIIRSLAVSQFSENHLVVGLKGNSGDAKIHFSVDLGDSWKPLNQDRSLCDSCEDILIAGTWKHGLFRSIKEGQHFEKLKNSLPMISDPFK